MSNPFDDKIKKSLENFEMPYDASSWTAFEKKLPRSSGTVTQGAQSGWIIAGISALVVIVATALWYFQSTDRSRVTEKVEIEQKVSETPQSALTKEPTVDTGMVADDDTQTTQAAASDHGPARSGTASAEPKKEAKVMNPNSSEKEVASDPLQPTKKPLTSVKDASPEKTETRPLIARFAASTLSACVGEEVNFINESSDLKASMFWEFGDGANSDKLHPSHIYDVPGNYTVRLKSEDGTHSDDRTLNVKVNPGVSAHLEASQKLNGYDALPYYHFETLLTADQNAVWSFSDGSVARGPSVDHLFRDAGRSKVTLTVKNAFGCSNTETWQVDNRKPFQLLAPTALSPDGDGKNDEFMPSALISMNVAFEMVILDSKGQEVFRTASAAEPWNGRMHNQGNRPEAGTYVWTVVLKEEIVNKKTFTGTITVLP